MTKDILLKLDRLQEDMRRYSEGIIIGYCPIEGEICIVKSPKDGRWYRAAVLQTTDSPVVLCVLVDYGRIQTIAVEHIRKIPNRFINYIPFAAQQAVINELKDIAPGDMNEKLAARVSALLPHNSFVTTRVVGRNDPLYVVEIPSITNILLEEGLLKSF